VQFLQLMQDYKIYCLARSWNRKIKSKMWSQTDQLLLDQNMFFLKI